MKFEIATKEASTQEQNEVEWVRWHDSIAQGEEFNMNAKSLRFNDEKQVFYLIGSETATSVYCQHHPNSKFQDNTTHGVRLANAVGRAFNLTGEVEANDLVDAFNAVASVDVKVVKTDKGVLWTVIPNALEAESDE